MEKKRNLWVIPTDKPSRLILQVTELYLSKYMEENEGFSEFNQNIYITSEQEIKEGDYVINNLDKLIGKSIRELNSAEIKDREYSKIILTTDQDLINDGVQAIDDEFLEWFVKNPSCEFVEIHKEKQHIGEEIDESYPKGFFDYKSIIPQEEPKQETLEEAAKIHLGIPIDRVIDEEERYYTADIGKYDSFIEGATWQAERMYSEAIEFAEWIRIKDFQTATGNKWIGLNMEYYTTQELYEQFKKK